MIKIKLIIIRIKLYSHSGYFIINLVQEIPKQIDIAFVFRLILQINQNSIHSPPYWTACFDFSCAPFFNLKLYFEGMTRRLSIHRAILLPPTYAVLRRCWIADMTVPARFGLDTDGGIKPAML